DSPEAAVAALADIVGKGDVARTEEIFGPGSVELFKSGDDEQDAKAAALVKELIAAKVDFEELGPDTRVALFGDKAWPFPIPLVRKDQRWRFDTEAGRQELLNRRVGYNELATLHSLHEYVDAQREYAAAGRDGNPPAFAQRFRSTEGRHDGLFWPAAEGEAPSPLGELVAEASLENRPPEPHPFRGYNYRILTAEAKSANAAGRSYLDGAGLMTGGFAAVAWPAKYGSSGVMTFLVNHRGIVYQKDLGNETDAVADAIKVYGPDATWTPTGDTLAAVEGADAELADADAPN
ncbi:MAG TPA: DUF2950 domain-containing protein, partial [Thermoanaerobaculia bacterium]|nr:DUF2950 domain-containing protein [Thermoanaerobaculia bacterium]